MRQTTLTPAAFHILLALTARDLHGLGIADWVEEATGGAVELGPGTLYRSLKELLESGLVRQAAAPDAEADPRRKYYGITPAGRASVSRDAARLQRLVELARERDLLPERA